jgi:hypothetical protein
MAGRLLCSLVLVSLLVSAGFAKKKPFPKIITNAKYVYITTYEGADQTSPRLTQTDQQAITNLREALRQWGYFTETIQRDQADLIFRVRKGGSYAKTGVNVGGGSTRDRGAAGPANVGIGEDNQADVGTAQDVLEVYDAKSGTNTAPLWRGMEMNGLEPPRLDLLRDLRKQVEESAKQP